MVPVVVVPVVVVPVVVPVRLAAAAASDRYVFINQGTVMLGMLLGGW